MTKEELKKKKIGVIEERSFTIKNDNDEIEEHYYLVKRDNDRYFVSFSEDANYCTAKISEEDMVELINDKNASDGVAFDIYMQSPQLNCWMN